MRMDPTIIERIIAALILTALLVWVAIVLSGCETLTVNVLSNNQLLSTRCQTATGAGEANAEGLSEGGGTTDATVPLGGL